VERRTVKAMAGNLVQKKPVPSLALKANAIKASVLNVKPVRFD
jgi:hypothetical protein